MKKIYILLIASLAIMFSSCGNDWLDLDPSTGTQTEKSIQSLNDAKASVIGLYYLIADYQSHGGRYTYYADVAGDDMRAAGSTRRTATIYTYRSTEQNVPLSYWSQPYRIIRNANNILAIIDNLELQTDDEKKTRDYIKGQALMIRAWSHFDLACVFGFPYLKDNGASLGAVIVTENLTSSDKPHRSTVKEMYDNLIIPDLLAAIPLMKSKASETEGQLNQSCAQLLLSRVYLYSGKYQEAYDMAKNVIDGASTAGFRLWTQSEYVSGNIWKTRLRTEGLMELAYSSSNQSSNECIAFLMNDNSDGYDDMVYTYSFIAAFDPADIRKASISKTKTVANNTPSLNYYCVKNAGPTGKVRDANVILFRLSEAYLNAAEASTHIATQAIKDKGRDYYNEIHTRAGLAAVTGRDITTDEVLIERRFELVGEGHRAFDLLRNNKKIIRTGSDHLVDISPINGNQEIDWNDSKAVLPIPIAERNANENIEPNPSN